MLSALLAAWLTVPAVAGTIVDFEGRGTVQPTGAPDELGNLPLFGSLSTSWLLGEMGPIGFNLLYTIQGGTGTHLGARGSGTSTVLWLGDPNDPPTPYLETGRMHDPEPGSLALFGLGLAAVGLSRRRAGLRPARAG